MGFFVEDEHGELVPGDWPQSEDFAQAVMRPDAELGARVVRVDSEGDAA